MVKVILAQITLASATKNNSFISKATVNRREKSTPRMMTLAAAKAP